MLIYGVCISDIRRYNKEKAENFLESLMSTECQDFAISYFENKKENSCSLDDWFYHYDFDNGYYGASAFLAKTIEILEEINITCDDSDGFLYLGLSAGTPWEFNDKTKRMTEKEFCNLLGKYISQITDEELEIKWWDVRSGTE